MDFKSVSFAFLALFMAGYVVSAEKVEASSVYIVHMDKSAMPSEFPTHVHWYTSLLSSVKGLDEQENIEKEDLYLYTYDTVMHGFSAKLTQSELDMLEEMPGHLSSFPDSLGTMDTTHSTEFLQLSPQNGILPKSKFGDDIIVGMLDTGIWPESRSFRDDGMGPVPARWNGICQNGTAFDSSVCNKKLIGARYFNKGLTAMNGKIGIDAETGYESPRDSEGHGSHTSSTAGGNYVENVDFYGYAAGTARGVAPAARIAMYKVIWSNGSTGSDALAAMETAISDGVDVMSMSFGYLSPPYFQDAIAMGAFAAIKNGVVVVCSAGNSGTRGIMHNGAPWIFTIGASTMDRGYRGTVKLGDGSVLKGSSFYTSENRSYHISESKLVYQSADPECVGPFDAATVKGAVVLCKNASFALVEALVAAGAEGLVGVPQNVLNVGSFPQDMLPTVVLNAEDGEALVKYVSSTSIPVVEIQLGETLMGVKPAPALSSTSSRGPYPPSQNILKPDVIAPGVNILAAWLPNTTEGDNYAIASGTSMSCPHVAGLVVLMKAVHKDWSPAMIKSALMTTSYTHDNTNNAITDLRYNGSAATPFDMGVGHVDPNKAVDPGLVYDISVEDYVNYLCTLNYTNQQIQSISGSAVSCASGLDLGSDGLNYPSFTAVFNKNATSSSPSTFKRTLTNVGDNMSFYNAVVEVPKGLKVQVLPDALEFKKKYEKVNYTLTVEVEEGVVSDFVLYGYLSWVDKKGHVVKSPVVALFQ